MTDILEALESQILITHFGIGTTYLSLGWDMKGPLEQWAVDHPEATQHIAQRCVDAGCHILPCACLSNRYRAAQWGLQDKVYELVYKAAKTARAVTPKHLYLAGETSVTGRFLKPVGDATLEEFYEAQKEVVLAMAEGGVDVIWILTMSDIEEAVAAVKAAKDHCDLPVLVTMAFDHGPRGCRTSMGVDPTTAARRLSEAGADVIGTNCGTSGVEDNTEIVREMRAASDKYILVRPNGGTPHVVDGKTVWPGTPEEFALESPKWVEAGANIVGGCCGTTEKHIRRMVEALNRSGIRVKSTCK